MTSHCQRGRLVGCLALLIVGCSDTAPSPPQHARAPVPTATSTSIGFRSGEGGYVQAPSHQRVIIFINGIFGDAISTWQNNSFYWPAEILKDADFRDVDVYVYSFQSPKLQTAQDITGLASRLRNYLQVDHVLETHQQVVFLCHSMGGLVVREFLTDFPIDPDKVPMIYFFATPTGGSNAAEIGQKVSPNSQLRDMTPLDEGNGFLHSLGVRWNNSELPNRVASYCAAELRKTEHVVLVVHQPSAFLLCTRSWDQIAADHMGIVKPGSTRDEPYVFFKAAYERTFSPVGAAIQRLATTAAPPLQAGEIREEHARIGTQAVALRRVKAVRYVDVGCAQTKEDDITLRVPLHQGEHVLAVLPYLDKTSNLKDQHVGLVSYHEGSAVVHYAIRGLDRTLGGLNCPGGGNAYIAATFVVQPAQQ